MSLASWAALTPSGSNAATLAADHSTRTHGFAQENLVSDVPGMATLLDPAVKNPWGIAFGPTTPLWVSNQFNPESDCGSPTCIPKPRTLRTKITLYRGANGVDPITKVPVEVVGSSPTGIVFNPTNSFRINQGEGSQPARFLFNETFVDKARVAPESRITGWSPTTTIPLPARTTSTRARDDGAFPVGLALVPGSTKRAPRLLVAGTSDNAIHVYDVRFRRVASAGQFTDPRAEAAGQTPYNVMYLDGLVYVAYSGEDGSASVTTFRPDGSLARRLVKSPAGGALVAPWGMAIAPAKWGRFGGALLVGDVDTGLITAFDRRTGAMRGVLSDQHGDPLVNPGLWGIEFGNGVIGTPRTLIFAAGVGSEAGGFGDDIYTHGLVGLIHPVRSR